MSARVVNDTVIGKFTNSFCIPIVPLPDGNGRMSRLIMNYQLMTEGFPAISIDKEDRLEYFKALDAYAAEGSLQPFADMVAGLVDRQLERYIELSKPQ